jgi:Uma2 family endonuclease
VATALPWGEPLTVDDLETMPDDGHRYELIDGVLVDVLSPSTRRYDLGSKGLAYAGYGVPAYWVVDPEPPVTLLVFGPRGDAYREVARVEGEEAYRATLPFEVTIVPARLADL